MSYKEIGQISVYQYWQRMVLIPSLVTSIVVCLVAISSLHYINRKNQLNELKKIAMTVSESIYDKIDSTVLKDLSKLVYDIGKFHDMIIIIMSPDNKPVVSYPAVTGLIDKSLSFDLVYNQPISLQDGSVLGYVVIKQTKQLFIGINDISLLIGTIVAIFVASCLWQLKFSKPMVSDILNLSMHNRDSNKFKFKEIREITRLLKKQSQDLNDLAVNKSIAQMTQMLAHDTKSPFAMIEGILMLLESNDDTLEVKKIAEMYLPEVRKALKSINGMFADILEVGNEKAPDKEPINVESIIESTLSECFRFNMSANIEFEYRFRHQHRLYVDSIKIARVFSNIVTNAVQAMNSKGRILFQTDEINDTVIITIGNSNSYIPPEERHQIFELFYTKDKKGGTGLGLAIARKIVAAHGGQIFCNSSQGFGTEFIFTLPVAPQYTTQINVELPGSSVDVLNAHTMVFRQTKSTHEIDNTDLECRILSVNREIHILIADDEPVYRNALRDQVQKSAIGRLIKLTFAKSGEDAIVAVRRSEPSIIIIDIDFGGFGSINGIEAVRRIRGFGSKSKICIHSDRKNLEFQTEAVKAGCDLFMPKPMTKSHLLSIIAASIEPIKNSTSKKIRPFSFSEYKPDIAPLFAQFWSNEYE